MALAKLKEEVAQDEQEDEQAARMPVYGTGVSQRQPAVYGTP
jgi:hypothetical protein